MPRPFFGRAGVAIEGKNGPKTKSFINTKEHFLKTEGEKRKMLCREEAFLTHSVGLLYMNKTPLQSALF